MEDNKQSNILTNEQFASALNVVVQNQNIINEKINSILELSSKQYSENDAIKEVINRQTIVIQQLTNSMQSIMNKLSDMQIQNQNSSSDVDNLSGSLSEISSQIVNLQHMMNEWKIYSDL